MQLISGYGNVIRLTVRRGTVLTGCITAFALFVGCQQDSRQETESTAGSVTPSARTAPPRQIGTTAKNVPNVAPLARIGPQTVAPRVPKVLLSTAHAEMCVIKTDDRMPEIKLPNTDGEVVQLSGLYGKTLTVVCFWKSDRAFAKSQLADLGPDVAEKFSEDGVNVVGIAVEETPESAERIAQKAGVEFPTLVDSDGQAFARVGKLKLPRTYLLDAEGNILWFDIEYSRSTRRDLNAAIRAVLRSDETAKRVPSIANSDDAGHS